MKMTYHGNTDSCHICGERHYATVDIFYPENAEHDKSEKRYLRICSSCIQNALHVVTQESPSEWRVNFASELKAADEHIGKAIAIGAGVIPSRHIHALVKAKRNIHVASLSA
jgi:hypothetical protein